MNIEIYSTSLLILVKIYKFIQLYNNNNNNTNFN